MICVNDSRFMVKLGVIVRESVRDYVFLFVTVALVSLGVVCVSDSVRVVVCVVSAGDNGNCIIVHG